MHATPTGLPSLGAYVQAAPSLRAPVRAGSRAASVVGASLAFFLAADVGAVTSYDGVVVATLLAIFQPQLGPCLLALVISVHDAPGMATPSLYLGVAGVALGMGLDELLARPPRVAPLRRRVAALVAMAVALALYGAVTSFLNEWLAGRQQSPYRHYTIIALLMGAMPLIAALAVRRVVGNAAARRDLGIACCCALAHVVVVVALEWRFGPFFGTSRAGAAEIAGAAQLVDAGARGVSRFTGPFLTPNNLAYVPALLLLVALWTGDSPRIRTRFLASYVLVGGGLALLGASRSMLLFFALTSVLMFWRRSKLASLLLAVAAAAALAHGLVGADAWVFARLDDLEFAGSTRELLWNTVVDDLGAAQWAFGAGLTHWDAMFARVYFEDRVSDPHNWILSIVGMFGVAGLLFYAKLGATLLRVARASSPAHQVVALNLAALYFLRDLMGVQYLLNNHPNACLNWLLLGLLIGGAPLERRPASHSERNVYGPQRPSGRVAAA